MINCVGCTSVAGCKPNCSTQPRAAPWGNDVALIKVSRSVRATCIMRGNAPWGVKGVMGYALSARGIFAPAQKCRMYQSRSTFPQGAALGYGQHLGLQPAPIIYRAFVQIGSFSTDVFLIFSAALGIARTSSALHSLARKLAAARHSPIKQVCRPLLSPCTNVLI